MDRTSQAQLLQSQLLTLTEQARAIDMREYENRPSAEIAAGVVPRVKALLTTTAAVAERILRICEGAASETAVPADGGDQRFCQAEDTLMTGDAVADLVFMARFELRSRREQLDRLAAGMAGDEPGSRDLEGNETPAARCLDLLSMTDSARRRIIQTATALENALSRAAGLEPQLDHATELEISLRVRRAYAKLRRAVLGGDAPGSDEVPARLRSCGTAIAQLIGRDAYWHLRCYDRLQLRRLQRQIVAFVTEEGNELEGRRLWQDLTSFVQLLEGINHRSELQEHDRELVEQAYGELFLAQSPPLRIPADTFARLTELYGRDQEIERLIDRRCRQPAEVWRVPLARLRTLLRRPESAVAGEMRFEPDDSQVAGIPIPAFLES